MEKTKFIESLVASAKEDYALHGLFPSVKIAQAILESNWGKSGLTKEANNLFGIKGVGTVGSITKKTREYSEEKGWIWVQAQFRNYNTLNESINDHTQFLLRSSRYLPVFQANNYLEAAHALQEAGYATDPNYASKLIRLIEEHQLFQWDTLPAPKPVATPKAKPQSVVSDYAREAHDWVVANGISDGLNPQDQATREQVWVMLYRMAQQM
ncbi:hypothetical protein BHU72_04610 [Desulfuribacillus stibiiarsenatis]|uniref:Mannosyl-glycoprotein endo-beta-N-acetylglucosamidase-like domain-containing protein n=1 Tax=Desulfuribacillus stibiiarsenatis TaxID=1390249 RepID=A0A1E5L5G4_9FIRM|nr:glycoside hydrolase family 73 protein [Desulfuribacillus stibiiarsenatis]OEH85375.1 hypothetical protein BHU72_04610 [Desulfuribacillus stibiiarsenatis]